MKNINDILNCFDGVTPSGQDRWQALCPHHDDRKQSLSIHYDRNTDKVLLKCHAGCTFNDIIGEVGLKVSDLTPSKKEEPTPVKFDFNNIVATYEYNNGTRKLRDINKNFLWQHKEGDQWQKGRGTTKHCLYSKGTQDGTVFIVEGEKDVDNLSKFGVWVVSGENGADRHSKWLPEYTEELTTAQTAIIIQDNDDIGKAYAIQVANSISDIVSEVKVLDLTAIYEELPNHGDISDVINIFHDATMNAVNTLIEQTGTYEPIMVDADLTDVKPNDFSDVGNAEKVADIYQGKIYNCSAIGWLAWNGKKWRDDSSDATIKRMVINFADAMLIDAINDAQNKETDKTRYLRHAEYTRKKASICGIVNLCESLLSVHSEELDSHHYLLNTDSGIVDLATGEVKPHDPSMLFTKIAPYTMNDDNSVMWDNFLDLITCNNEELKEYLHYYIGMCATGEVKEEKLGIAVGGGRNGKSTFFNAIANVLGDYASTIDSTVLTQDQQNRKATLATLRGRRFVTCGELEEGKRLSTSLLKKIASTDRIDVERKYKDPESIMPTHHVTLFTNHLPRIGSNDEGTWRRIIILPFDATMPSGDKDIKNYAKVLSDTCGGYILKWVIEGAMKFIANNYTLPPCSIVTERTNEYRQREDWLNQFITECCIVDENEEIRAGQLYKAYYDHACDNGDYRRPRSVFVGAMESLGFKQEKRAQNKMWWKGINILSDQEKMPEFTPVKTPYQVPFQD